MNKCEKHQLYLYADYQCPKCLEEKGELVDDCGYSYIGVETEEERIERLVLQAQIKPFLKEIGQAMNSGIVSLHHVGCDTKDEMVQRAIDYLSMQMAEAHKECSKRDYNQIKG